MPVNATTPIIADKGYDHRWRCRRVSACNHSHLQRRTEQGSDHKLLAQPVIKEQGEAYGLIAMTCARINELSVVDTYYWPDYDTFEKAKNEYAGKFVEATRKAGAKVDIKEAYVYRAWFDGTDDMKSLTNF